VRIVILVLNVPTLVWAFETARKVVIGHSILTALELEA
jgi:hypothetical protein